MKQARSTVVRPVPILRYFSIDPRPGDAATSIDAMLFVDHLDALLDVGYIPLTISDLDTAIRLDAPVPALSILLTFDHGLRGFYQYVLPALRRRDIPSTVFITTGSVGRQIRSASGLHAIERVTMSWSQLKVLADEDVVIARTAMASATSTWSAAGMQARTSL